MNNNETRYDAFISYRHCELDQFVAENLHHMMEKYKLPSNVAKKVKKNNGKTRITRVFRDQDELPLTSNLEDPIINALKNSEWLIVICSPRLKLSTWCLKEIETFVGLHGREKVLAVLVEGEPEDSFPDILLHRDVLVQGEDGLNKVIHEKIEPLAADFRAETNEGRLKIMKKEILRLLSPMFGIDYFDLRQRSREQKMREMIALAALIATIGIAFGTVSTLSAIQLNKQNNLISQQSQQITSQLAEIADQNDKLKTEQARNLAETSEQFLLNDNIKEALDVAYTALTKDGDVDFPYTDEARYALTTALNPYAYQGGKVAKWQIALPGVPKKIEVSADLKTAAVYDSADMFTFIDVERGKVIGHFSIDDSMTSVYYLTDRDTMVYLNGQTIVAYNIKTGEQSELVETDIFSVLGQLQYNKRDDILAASTYSYVYLLKASDLSIEHIISMNGYIETNYWLLNKQYIAVCALDEDNNRYLQVFDIEAEKMVYERSLKERDNIEAVLADGDSLYMAINANDTDSSDVKNVSIYADNIITGEKLWTNNDVRNEGNKLVLLTDSNGQRRLAYYGSNFVKLFNADSGNLDAERVGDSILWNGSSDSVSVYVTSDSKEMYVIGDQIFGLSGSLDCSIASANVCSNAGEGYIIGGPFSTSVNYYAKYLNTDIQAYNEEIKGNIGTCVQNDEAVALAASKGIDNSSIVSAITYDDKKERMCVSYKDKTVVLIDAETLEKLDTWKLQPLETRGVCSYYGEDKDGNQYWASEYIGYCIGPDNKRIARIDYLSEIDKEKNLLLFENSDGNISMPIYSLEELLTMAKERLGY